MISCIATRFSSRRPDTGHRAIVVAVLVCLTCLLASENVALAQQWSLTFVGHVYERDVHGQVVPAADIQVWLDGSNDENSPGVRLDTVRTDHGGQFRIRITRSFDFYNLGLRLRARTRRVDIEASGGEWQPAKGALRLYAMGRNLIDDIEFVIDRRIPRPDLAVVDVRHEASAAPRREIVFQITIENQGPGRAGRTNVLMLLEGGERHFEPLEPLDSGATRTVMWRPAVPAAYSDDEIRYIIAVDPNDTLAEMNEENNRWNSVVALPRPDLTIPNAVVMQVGPRELILHAVVENAGNSDAGVATLSIRERNGRLQPVQQTSYGLHPGASQEIESVVKVPRQSIGQPLQFDFEIDADSAIVESNEHNNFAYAGPIVVPVLIKAPSPERRMPDLMIESLDTETLTPGSEQVVVRVIVRNLGDADARPTRLDVSASSRQQSLDAVFADDTWPTASQAVPALGVDERTAPLTMRLAIPSAARGTTQHFYAIANRLASFDEHDHSNNSVRIERSIPSSPPPPPPRVKLYFAIAGIVLATAALLGAKRLLVPRPLHLVPVSCPGKQGIDCAVDTPQPAIRVEPVSDTGEQSVEPIEIGEVNS